MLSNFGQPFDVALETAASLGFSAVQIALAPESSPDEWHKMSEGVRRAGLEISAICCDAGDLGEDLPREQLDKLLGYLDGAAAIGEGICQTHVGVMPHDASGPRWKNFVRNCGGLADEAVNRGACLALETGPEPARVMEKLMRAVDSPGLRVNYDPANFIIWPALLAKFPDLRAKSGLEAGEYDRAAAIADFEPVEGVARLAPYIVHTHAKDGVGSGGWEDVPLGTGWVDWPRYLDLLQAGGYDGYLTIEREGGEDRVGQIAAGAEFLRGQLRDLAERTA